jgi:hypothetical protein
LVQYSYFFKVREIVTERTLSNPKKFGLRTEIEDKRFNGKICK